MKSGKIGGVVSVERIDFLGLQQSGLSGGQYAGLTQASDGVGIQTQDVLEGGFGGQGGGTFAGSMGRSFEKAASEEEHIVVLSRANCQGAAVEV